jgi:cholesterol oxidase
MGFQHDGKSYYLAGQKDVRQDPIFDLWKATTTLYSKLHEGTDKSGPVVGAGILSLGVRQLIDLMSTMKAPGAATFTEKSEAMAKFGRFFLGELWDTYVRHALP